MEGGTRGGPGSSTHRDASAATVLVWTAKGCKNEGARYREHGAASADGRDNVDPTVHDQVTDAAATVSSVGDGIAPFARLRGVRRRHPPQE